MKPHAFPIPYVVMFSIEHKRRCFTECPGYNTLGVNGDVEL